MEPSLIITWVHFSIYGLFFLILSIWSAFIIGDEYKMDKQKDEHRNNLQTSNESQKKDEDKTINSTEAKDIDHESHNQKLQKNDLTDLEIEDDEMHSKQQPDTNNKGTTKHESTENAAISTDDIITNKNLDERKADTSDDNQNMDNTHTEQRHSTSNHKKHGCKHYLKKWMKLTWSKKRIYLSIIPHLFDQATDCGVIVTYYGFVGNDDIEKNVDVVYWFYLSILILIIHRVVSTYGVWLLTHNRLNILLQAFDLLMLRAVYTSYKLNRDEPSTSQRYLGLLEATLEGI